MPPPLPGPLTRAEGFALIRKALDGPEWDNLIRSPEGRATATGIVDVFVDLSGRLDRTSTARHLVRRASDVGAIASGAAAVTTTLEVRRAPTKLGKPRTLLAGTVARTASGHLFRFDAAVTFAAGEVGPRTVAATAVVAGTSPSSIAGTISAFADVSNGANGDLGSVSIVGTSAYLAREAGDRFFPTFLGLYVEFTGGANVGLSVPILAVLGPDRVQLDTTETTLVAEALGADWVIREWSELGFTVTNPADTTTGSDDELDQLARETGRHRAAGETDAQLIVELRSLDDTVSPMAIIRLANRILGPYGPVRLYETGTPANESDATYGLEAFPGFVADADPCDVEPDQMSVVVAGGAGIIDPPVGLHAMAPLYRHFLVRYDGFGLGDPGCYAKDSVGVDTDDDAPTGSPMAAAADADPCDGFASDDEAIRAAIYNGIERTRAAGMGWQWYPRYFPTSP